MTAIKKPAEFWTDIQDLKRALDDLGREYAVAHDSATDNPVIESAKVTTTKGFSSQTETAALAHTRLKGELRFASEWLQLTLHGRPARPKLTPPEPKVFGVYNQVDALRSRLESDASRPGIEAPVGPPIALKSEVMEAVEAQEKRKEAGDIHSGEQEAVRERLGMLRLEQEFQPRRGIR